MDFAPSPKLRQKVRGKGNVPLLFILHFESVLWIGPDTDVGMFEVDVSPGQVDCLPITHPRLQEQLEGEMMVRVIFQTVEKRRELGIGVDLREFLLYVGFDGAMVLMGRPR